MPPLPTFSDMESSPIRSLLDMTTLLRKGRAFHDDPSLALTPLVLPGDLKDPAGLESNSTLPGVKGLLGFIVDEPTPLYAFGFSPQEALLFGKVIAVMLCGETKVCTI